MSEASKRSSYVQKKIGHAIKQYGMIEDGDKILVGISGGKDSLVLLDLLKERIQWSPAKYTLHAVHVQSNLNPNYAMVDYLIKHFELMEVDYTIKKIEITEARQHGYCFWCSWNRRKILFNMAKELGCKKIALGHHKDDIIETMLINLFFNGNISTMNPMQEFFKKTLHIIRPLAFCEEHNIEEIAREMDVVQVKEECPYSDDTARKYIKGLIAEVKKRSPYVKENIIRSLARVRKDYVDIHED